MADDALVVCLSFPPFHDPKYVERLLTWHADATGEAVAS